MNHPGKEYILINHSGRTIVGPLATMEAAERAQAIHRGGVIIEVYTGEEGKTVSSTNLFMGMLYAVSVGAVWRP